MKNETFIKARLNVQNSIIYGGALVYNFIVFEKVLATLGLTIKNLIMQKIKEIWKELNGQPTERTDKIVKWWVIFCRAALIIAACCMQR